VRAACALAAVLACAPSISRAQTPLPETADTATSAEVPAVSERNPTEAEEVRRLAEQTQPSADPGARTMGAQLLSTMFMMVAICALAYLVLGKLLPKVMGLSVAGRRAMVGTAPTGVLQVVDRLALDPRRALIVVKVGEEHFLIGMTDQAMTRLAKLDDTTLPPPAENKPILGAFGRLLERRLDKEGS